MLVRTFRHRQGLTLKTLARKCGCSVSFLCDIENGRRVPDTDLAVRMERALDVNPNGLALPCALKTGRIAFDPAKVSVELVEKALFSVRSVR